jgi:hypothetical protein
VGAGVPHRKAGRIALTLGVAALAIASVLAPPAVAKKKKITIVGTSSTAVPMPPGSVQSTTPRCAKGLHVTGGGFSITPEFNGNGTLTVADDTGIKALTQVSYPSSRNTWTATTSSFAMPSTAGALTGFARCEHNKLGKVAGTVFGSQALNPGDSFTLNLPCPSGTHVLSGGYLVDKPFNNTADSSHIFILGSYRSASNVWTVSAFSFPNPSFPVSTLTPYAICEKSGSRPITQVQQSVPLTDNASAAATASCSKKHHAVGGGFSFTPVQGPSNVPPVPEVQESAPSGARDWVVHGYDFPFPSVTPPGTTMSAYAYCRSDSTKKKKK